MSGYIDELKKRQSFPLALFRPEIRKLDSGGEQWLPFAIKFLYRMWVAGVGGMRRIEMPDGAVIELFRPFTVEQGWVSITKQGGVVAHVYSITEQSYVGVLDKAGDFVWKTKIEHPVVGPDVYPVRASKSGNTIIVTKSDPDTFFQDLYAVTSSSVTRLTTYSGDTPSPITDVSNATAFTGMDVSGTHIIHTGNGSQTFTPGSPTWGNGVAFYRQIVYRKPDSAPLEKAWAEDAAFLTDIAPSLGVSSWVAPGATVTFLSATTTTGYDLTIATGTGITTDPPVVGVTGFRYLFCGGRAVTPTDVSPGLPTFFVTTVPYVTSTGGGVVNVEIRTCVWRMKNGVVTLLESRTGTGTFTLAYISFQVRQRGWDSATVYGGQPIQVATTPSYSALPVGGGETEIAATPDGRCVTLWRRATYSSPGAYGSPSNTLVVDQLEVSVDGVLKSTIPLDPAPVLSRSVAVQHTRNDAVMFVVNTFTTSFTAVKELYEVSLATGAVLRTTVLTRDFAWFGAKAPYYAFGFDNPQTSFEVYGGTPYALLGTYLLDGDNENIYGAWSSWDAQTGAYYVLRPAADYDVRAMAVSPLPLPAVGYDISSVTHATVLGTKDLPDASDPPVDVSYSSSGVTPIILDGVY